MLRRAARTVAAGGILTILQLACGGTTPDGHVDAGAGSSSGSSSGAGPPDATADDASHQDGATPDVWVQDSTTPDTGAHDTGSPNAAACLDTCNTAYPSASQSAQLTFSNCCGGACSSSCPSFDKCFGFPPSDGASVTCQRCAIVPLKAGTCGGCSNDPDCNAYVACLSMCF